MATVDFQCQAEFDPYTQKYTIIGNWSISNPLAAEVIPSYNLDLHLHFSARALLENIRDIQVTEIKNVSLTA